MKTDEFKKYVHPLSGNDQDYDVLMDHVADASMVLLGEATHGTHEFYAARAAISKRLITEKGFSTILIEGDWPDAYRINRYINGEGSDKTSIEWLAEFKRFPAWMWRNQEFASFIDWLRTHNRELNEMQSPIHLYGLDLYSLHRSIELVIHELHKIDPKEAEKARARYQCFDAYAEPQKYGYMASLYPDKSCRDNVIEQLIEIKKKRFDFFKDENLDPIQEKLYIEQNALVVQNAEKYYTSLFGGDQAMSWNIRDTHMMETVNKIVTFNKINQRNHKIIVWAHNSHLGDARATQMASHGEVNVGQLVKKSFSGDQAISVGFTTYSGTVSAASSWGGDVERKTIQPALGNSVEAFLHSFGLAAFIMIPNQYPDLYTFLDHDDYLQRAIGVIYLPSTERQSHYFYAQVSQQFDVIIHYDTTSALIPLEKSTQWEKGEDVPETFPFGV